MNINNMINKRIYTVLIIICVSYFSFSFIEESPDSLSIDKLQHLLKKAEEYRVKSFDKCLEYATQAKELAEKENKIKELAEANKTIGIAHYFQGNYNEAIEYYKEASGYYNLMDDKIGIAKIYNNIGIIYQRWSEFDSAYNHYFQSLKIYEEENDTLGMAGAFNNIGNIETLLSRYNNSIEHFKEAYEIFVLYNNKREQGNVLNNIGYVYEKMNNSEMALSFYQNSLKIREEIIDNYGIGVSLNNIGVIYLRNKDFNNALSYFNKSLFTREKLGHLEGITATRTLIGETYAEQGFLNKAIHEFNKALELANEANLRDKRLEIYSDLNEVLIKKREYKKAHYYLTKYIALKDSIYNENKLEQITTIESKYEKEKNLKEIKLLKYEKQLQENEIKKQKLLRNIFILSVISILLFVSLIINRYRLILKTKKVLEKQNITIKEQHEEITEINKNLTDSIVYSKQLMSSVLPQKDYIKTIFDHFFILNKPKNIVSGDFYWITKNKNKIIFAVADCTGHGVPGAIMSMLGISFLNEIVGQKVKISANEILNELREKVIVTLHQTGKKKESKDGIDIALCILDKETNTLEFSGAFNSAYIIQDSKLLELKGDKNPIGIFVSKHKSFTSQQIAVKPGDIVYLTSDGFFHQFGGENKTKFSSSAFKQLLIENHKNNFTEQLQLFENTYNQWKGANEQVDDIMVFGAKI
jgi:serine phosphatase RsbU (regulator of sigma subunit)